MTTKIHPIIPIAQDLGIDPRLMFSSYSSMLTLHACPRKLQLYRLRAEHAVEQGEDQEGTFAFGHVVGEGVQRMLAGESLDSITFDLFLMWHADLFFEDHKRKKSFWLALVALRKFANLLEQGVFEDYEVVMYKNTQGDYVPALELSFVVIMPNGLRYRGFFDAVLRNKETGEYIVLELKTTSINNITPAMYKNSSQAVGYSVVLDYLVPGLGSYQVLYFVYKTKLMEYEPQVFNKSRADRASWLAQLKDDSARIVMYAQNDVFPTYGESCFDFFRECEYFGRCHMSTELLTKPYDPAKDKLDQDSDYTVAVHWTDLVQQQLELA